MEEAISSSVEHSDLFFDAFDAFTPPDFDENLDPSSSSPPGTITNKPENESTLISSATLPELSTTSLRRRRPSSQFADTHQNSNTNALSCESDSNFEISSFSERWSNIPSGGETSTLTSEQNVDRRDRGQETSLEGGHEYPVYQSLLVSFADLVVRAIFFQVNMLISFLTFPMWLTYNSFLFVVNPLGTLRCTVDDLKKRVLWVRETVLESFSPFVPEMFKREEGIGKLVGRLACGCFWFCYVGIALSGLLMTGFLCGSFLMSRIVEEPLQMIRNLSFDYTKASPDAYVMLMPCDGAGCSLDFDGKGGFEGNVVGRAIPPNHKLQLSISLTLPESDYNRNLGVFQVSVEFISTNARITSRISKPCMLRFKSSHIRFMETFLKSGPLLAGYSSESQLIDLHLPGFTEGYQPTMAIRIVLEQRAEFRPGAGIPEIYAASLKLESELPILKKMIWSWRRTLLIWFSMGFFVWELFIVLACCRPMLFPLGKRSDGVSPSRRRRTINHTTE